MIMNYNVTRLNRFVIVSSELRAEIENMRNQAALADEDVISASMLEIDNLRGKLAAKEREIADKERY